MSDLEAFKFRCVRPVIPPPELWMPWVEQIYARRIFSNFGPVSRELESALKQRFGDRDECCVLAASATSAIAACFLAGGVTGKVLVPAFTFPATLSAVKMIGAEPVIIDVAENDWSVSAPTLDEAFRRTGASAAVLVAPFGLRRAFGDQIAICRRYGAVGVIDNAAGFGIPRQPAVVLPTVFEVFSLHATKPFAIGEGGAAFTHQSCESRLRSALNFALDSQGSQEGPQWGINGKLSEFHAAVGLAQLQCFPAQLEKRQAVAHRYIALVEEYPAIFSPKAAPDSPWQFFPILMPTCEHASAFIAAAASRGLEVRRYYRPSLSLSKAARCLHACPVAESLSERMCCLPVYGDPSEGELDEIFDIVGSSLASAF